MNITWKRVTAAAPCPICERPDYCTRTADGTKIHCMRVESTRPAKSGGGWIHLLNTDVAPRPFIKPPRRIEDVSGVADKMFTDHRAPAKRLAVAAELGVSLDSLIALRCGIGWDYNGREFASFPARGARGEIIGITRRYDGGEKKTMHGTSNSGIFAAEKWWELPGPILIVEGASDVAALFTYGFAALGRPSNIGGAKIIETWIKRRATGREVIVIGENDLKTERVGTTAACRAACAGCAWCWPGRYGAVRVAAQLGAQFRMLPQMWKDVREWAGNVDEWGAMFRNEFAEWLEA